jgi:hypothetical protein
MKPKNNVKLHGSDDEDDEPKLGIRDSIASTTSELTHDKKDRPLS